MRAWWPSTFAKHLAFTEELDECELGGVSGAATTEHCKLDIEAIEVNWFNGIGVCGNAIVVGINVLTISVVGT